MPPESNAGKGVPQIGAVARRPGGPDTAIHYRAIRRENDSALDSITLRIERDSSAKDSGLTPKLQNK